MLSFLNFVFVFVFVFVYFFVFARSSGHHYLPFFFVDIEEENGRPFTHHLIRSSVLSGWDGTRFFKAIDGSGQTSRGSGRVGSGVGGPTRSAII